MTDLPHLPDSIARANPPSPEASASVNAVYATLLPHLRLASVQPFNPVVVHHCPAPWQVLGAGNYAAVFSHPAFSEQVVKVYAPGRPGLPDEVEVYRRLGPHPAFSTCFYAGENFLVLKRLYGTTLYDCLHQGIPIPEQVVQDIDAALAFARQRGLFPHDVHGRNVMMAHQRGVVVDVSDPRLPLSPACPNPDPSSCCCGAGGGSPVPGCRGHW
jgi:hypothetical protein